MISSVSLPLVHAVAQGAAPSDSHAQGHSSAQVCKQKEASTTTASICSDQLLQGARAVHIVHREQIYCLQATRLGKLILTKPV
jgi:hemin uptake protein HemP